MWNSDNLTVDLNLGMCSNDFYPIVIIPTVHLCVCSIMASLCLLFGTLSRKICGPLTDRRASAAKNRAQSANVILVYCSVHPTLRRHVTCSLDTNNFHLRPNAHSLSSPPPAPPRSTLANIMLAASRHTKNCPTHLIQQHR